MQQRPTSAAPTTGKRTFTLIAGQSVLRNFTLELAAVTTSVVVVGSRAEPRSVTESTVPVDVLAVKGSLRRFVP